MSVRVKFCGLTTRPDVESAIALGAEYIGVVFAGGPRKQSYESAAGLFAGVTGAATVGVMGELDGAEMERALGAVPLNIVQLHADPTPSDVDRARKHGAQGVWGVLRVSDGAIPAGARELFRAADAVVVDTRAASGLGGTGATFDWERAAAWIAPLRADAMLVLAGGLTPLNVAKAVRALRPDVVDVSSGVEVAPGVKDLELMRRFADAARAV